MKTKFLPIIAIAVLVVSCKPIQRLNYLQDMTPGMEYIIQHTRDCY